MCDRLRGSDQLLRQRRNEEDQKAQVKMAWEVILTLDHLIRHLRIHKNPAKNQERILQGAAVTLGDANRAQHFHKRLVDRGPVLLVRVSQHVCRCMHPAVGPPYRRPQRCGCDQGCIDDLFYPPEFWYRSPFSSTRCRLSWM